MLIKVFDVQSYFVASLYTVYPRFFQSTMIQQALLLMRKVIY